jgi:hypothetical protein
LGRGREIRQPAVQFPAIVPVHVMISHTKRVNTGLPCTGDVSVAITDHPGAGKIKVKLRGGHEQVVGLRLAIERRATEMRDGSFGMAVRIIYAVKHDAVRGQQSYKALVAEP